MSKIEIDSREEILFENYAKTVNIEALTMIEMASRDIIPAVSAYLADLASAVSAKQSVLPDLSCKAEKEILRRLSILNDRAFTELEMLKSVDRKAAAVCGMAEKAEAYRDLVLPAMTALRSTVDEMETLTSSEYWPLPTYGDLMFNV